MALLVGEPDDLVLERRAVPRADALNLSVEQRRLVDVGAHEIAHAIVRMQKVAVICRRVCRRGQEREQDRGSSPRSTLKRARAHLAIEVDAFAVEPRWRSRFQSAPVEPE